MNGNEEAKPRRRHLQSPESIARARTRTQTQTDLTRAHGQSNGLRVHGIYFALVSIVGLIVIIVVIALASSMM